MRDISKKLTVINTGKKESEAGAASQPSGVVYVGAGGGGGGGNLNDYLLKSIWNKVWEIRTDSQGAEYIFGKLPVVTQYGITMYSGDNVDIPTIAEGLPFDGRTIWFNPTTGQIEVLGGTGGGSGEGVSNFWDLNGIPSWITNTKPTYSYSEIQGTPDLSKYALVSDIPSLSGYATEAWVLGRGFALSSDLSDYIPISGYTDILGEKNFVGGLKVNGSPIYYDKDKKYWKLEGDLLVTGGVTMYGNDSDFVASTIMDAIVVDGTTISKEGGVLKVIGGTGGGGISSVTSQMIVDALGYTPASATALNGYLPLSGGTIESENNLPLTIKRNNAYGVGISFANTNETISIQAYNGVLSRIDNSNNGYTIWDSGNDGSGSGLDADLLDGFHVNGSQKPYGKIPLIGADGVMEVGKYFDFHNDNTTGSDFSTRLQCSGEHGNTISLPSANGTLALTSSNVASATRIQAYTHDTGEKVIISGSRSDNTFPRKIYDNGIGLVISQTESNGTVHNGYIASINSNVASATKLQTARAIWGQSFDGTGNISGAISGVETITFNSSYAVNIDRNSNFVFKQPSTSTSMDWSIQKSDGSKIMMVRNDGNVGVGTTSPIYKLHVEGNIYSQNTFLTHSGYYIASSSTYERGRLFADQSTDSVWLQAGNWGGTTLNGTLVLSGINGRDLSLCKITGPVLATGGITMYSDQRKKTILNHVELSLQQVANAPLIEHYYNSDEKRTTHVGSIAQYWAEMNDWFCKKDSEGFYTMEIQNAALASAISVARELVKFETETDRRIRLLEDENKRLKEEIEQLKWNIA